MPPRHFEPVIPHCIKKYLDLAFTLNQIYSIFKNFYSGERIRKVAERWPYSQEQFVNSRISVYMWTVAKLFFLLSR